MLNFILGIAGSGKSTRIFDRIAAVTTGGGRAMLIVPEQISFESERRIIQRDDIEGRYTEVLSFNRLAERSRPALGVSVKPLLDEAGGYMMLAIALEEIKEHLKIYRRQYQSAGFISKLMETVAELKNSGVTPEMLSRFSFDCPDGSLKEKSYELSLIADAYNSVVSRSHTDPRDLLAFTADSMEGADYFKGYSIFLDGYSSFTFNQYRIISQMLTDGAEVYITLTTDGVSEYSELFGFTAKAYRRLLRTAQNSGVEVKHELLTGAKGALPMGLIEYERRMRTEVPGDAVEGDCLTLHKSVDRREELRWIAATVSRLVKEQGYRYKDVTVIFRSLSPYAPDIAPIMDEYDISYHLDSKKDIGVQGVAGLLQSVLRLCVHGYSTPTILSLLKSPLLLKDTESVSELENYCYIWSVDGSRWNVPFINHPQGIGRAMTESDTEQLARIEGVRSTFVESLNSVKQAVKTEDGGEVALALYSLLGQFDVKQKLIDFSEYMDALSAKTFLEEHSREYEGVMAVLDMYHRTLSGIKTDSIRLCELFELACSTISPGSVPATLDQILLTDASRVREVKSKVVFIPGAVEGEYPLLPSDGGLLSLADRSIMSEGGMELLNSRESMSEAEQLSCYQAVTAATERLYISYPTSVGGNTSEPSALYRIGESVSKLHLELSSEYFATTLKSSATIMAQNYRTNPRIWATLKEVAGVDSVWHSVEMGINRPVHSIADRTKTEKLFGSTVRLSPTRLERYSSCPFSFFAQNGLRLRRRNKAELSPIESGSLIHNALEQLVKKYGGEGLHTAEESELRGSIEEIVADYIAERILGELPKRQNYLFKRLVNSIYPVARRLGEEFSQSKFEPCEFELRINADSKVKPLVLTTSAGNSIVVEGTVDRVDTAVIGGEKYVRVVDYKQGGRTFRLRDVYHGLNMQMLIYLFTIWHRGEGELENVLPAGVLYMPSLDKYITAPDGEAFLKARNSYYRMNGLILDDPEVLSAMDVSGGGVFIPSSRSKDSFASLEELGKIYELVTKNIRDIAEQLLGGKVEASPLGDGNTLPCEYCDYRWVCGFEMGDPYREILNRDRAEILKEVGADE